MPFACRVSYSEALKISSVGWCMHEEMSQYLDGNLWKSASSACITGAALCSVSIQSSCHSTRRPLNTLIECGATNASERLFARKKQKHMLMNQLAISATIGEVNNAQLYRVRVHTSIEIWEIDIANSRRKCEFLIRLISKHLTSKNRLYFF